MLRMLIGSALEPPEATWEKSNLDASRRELTRDRAGVRIVFTFVGRLEDFEVVLPLASARFDAELGLDELGVVDSSIGLAVIAAGIEMARERNKKLFIALYRSQHTRFSQRAQEHVLVESSAYAV